MNMKYITLFSLLFVFGINPMSPFDQYENTREEFVKCRDTWSSLLLGCDNQMSAFNEARNQLTHPFNEIIEESKNDDKILSDTADQCDKENLLISSVRKKYLKEEEVHGLNSARHYIAKLIIRKIGRDNPKPIGILLSDFIEDDNRSSLEEQLIKKINEIKEPNYYITRDRYSDTWAMQYRNRLYNVNHINLLLRESNVAIISQAAEEAEKHIYQLRTKK